MHCVESALPDLGVNQNLVGGKATAATQPENVPRVPQTRFAEIELQATDRDRNSTHSRQEQAGIRTNVRELLCLQGQSIMTGEWDVGL